MTPSRVVGDLQLGEVKGHGSLESPGGWTFSVQFHKLCGVVCFLWICCDEAALVTCGAAQVTSAVDSCCFHSPINSLYNDEQPNFS